MHPHTIAAIKARCASMNKAHATLNAAAPVIFSWVKTMNGQKIFKSTGGLLKKFADTKPDIPNVYIECGHYSIRAEARNCEVTETYINGRGETKEVRQSGGFSRYFADIMGDGTLHAIERYLSHPDLKSDYDPEKVIDTIESLEKLKLDMESMAHGYHGIIHLNIQINTP